MKIIPADHICIYHANCSDGFMAATIVKMWFDENKYSGDNVEYFPGIYQTWPPDVSNKHVIMVDFSYPRDVLITMSKTAKSILILDHHASAEKSLIDLPDNVNCFFDMSRSGAMMAWDYYYGDRPPKLIEHIQDRDLWNFIYDDTRDISAALKSYEHDFDVWKNLLNSDLNVLASEGKIINKKYFKDIHELIASGTHSKNIGGYKVPVLNIPPYLASDAGEILAKGQPFAACYWHDGDETIYSLRSDSDGIDVSEIAELFGGGGHKHAAGFKIKNNAFGENDG